MKLCDIHGGRPAGKSREMAVEIITNGCPREAERHVNGDSEKSGGVTDFSVTKSCIKGNNED